MSYEEPVDQRSMVLDEWRNSFYERALSSLVTPESIVLDAGSGLGVLGFLAASLGARKVYMVEPATNLEAIKLIARANGVEDRVELIKGTIEQAAIQGKVDIITSVFTGNFLLEEDLLPILFRARDTFLKPGGTLLPGRGKMKIAPVSLQEYYDENIACWRMPRKVDHSPMHSFAVNQVYYDSFLNKPFQALAPPSTIMDLDFYTACEAGCDAEINITVDEPGTLHGFLGWFDMSFEGEWLSTSPEEKETHWRQAYLPIDPVIPVNEGDVLHLKLHRPEFGEWSWTLEAAGAVSKHSTFLSQPFTPAELARKSREFKPGINDQGKAARFLLERIDGQISTRELARLVQEEFPALFVDEKSAQKFVRRLVERYCE